MADVTDPQAIRFANEQIRPLADAYARLHKMAKEICFLWQAKGIAALIPADASPVVDGSPGDGRTAVAGADLNAIIGIAAAFYTGNEASDNATILQVGKVAVNP